MSVETKQALRPRTPNDLAGWTMLDVGSWPERWRRLRFTEEGLEIRPEVSSWYEDVVGGFLYRDVSGDFTVTARVKVTGAKGGPPRRSFSLGGLMARKRLAVEPEHWKRGQENWLFLTTGTADRPGEQQFEVKTTFQSVSTLRTYPAPEGWVELKLVRLRELFTMFYRQDAGEWQYVDQWVRPDLPDALQVGLIAYTDWDGVAPLYPDFERINGERVENGVPDLVMTVDAISLRSHEVARFGTRLTDFASLGTEKVQQLAGS